MTIRTMSLDQLRDWHAKREGFYFSIDRDMGPIGWCDKDGKLIGDDPFPPTLDGAASAMPEGWGWAKERDATYATHYLAWRSPTKDRGRTSFSVPDTGDEVRDRYELAKRAIEATQEKGTNDKA